MRFKRHVYNSVNQPLNEDEVDELDDEEDG